MSGAGSATSAEVDNLPSAVDGAKPAPTATAMMSATTMLAGAQFKCSDKSKNATATVARNKTISKANTR